MRYKVFYLDNYETEFETYRECIEYMLNMTLKYDKCDPLNFHIYELV